MCKQPLNYGDVRCSEVIVSHLKFQSNVTTSDLYCGLKARYTGTSNISNITVYFWELRQEFFLGISTCDISHKLCHLY